MNWTFSSNSVQFTFAELWTEISSLLFNDLPNLNFEIFFRYIIEGIKFINHMYNRLVVSLNFCVLQSQKAEYKSTLPWMGYLFKWHSALFKVTSTKKQVKSQQPENSHALVWWKNPAIAYLYLIYDTFSLHNDMYFF